MKVVIQKIMRWILQASAGVVIVLALLVGVSRLLLPEVASFSADIRSAVRTATGFELDFDLLSAGMSLYGPELRLTLVEVSWPDETKLLKAEQISVSLDLKELVFTQRIVPKRILLRGSSVDVEISPDGQLIIQGRPVVDLSRGGEPFDPDALPDLRLHFEDVRFSFADRRFDRPELRGVVNDLVAELNEGRVELVGDIEPGKLLGRKLDVSGYVPLALGLSAREVAADRIWNLRVSAQDYRLDSWLDLLQAPELPIINSQGSAVAEFSFIGMHLVELQSEFDLKNVEFSQQQDSTAVIDSIAGAIEWRVTDSGWNAAARELTVDRNGQQWPASNIGIDFSEVDSVQQITASANFLRTDDLVPLLRSVDLKQLKEFGLTGLPSGELRDVKFSISRTGEKILEYDLSGDFSALGYVSPDHGIDIMGFSGSVTADQTGGSLELDTRNARLGLASVFRKALPISHLNGVAVWRSSPDGYRVLANSLELETPHGQADASFELTTNLEFGEPWIDLRASASVNDISQADIYLPTVLPAIVLDWLDVALLGGYVPDAMVKLRGPLQQFPFADDSGEFFITVDFRDSSLAYGPGWPAATNANGTLFFSGPSLYTVENTARVGGIDVTNVDARIEDLRDGLLTIDATAQTELAKVLGFLQNSPIRAQIGPILDNLEVTGPADGAIALRLPIRDIGKWQLTGHVDTSKATLTLAGLDFGFSDVKGRAQINNTRIYAADVSARIFDAPVVISIQPTDDSPRQTDHIAEVVGTFAVPRLADQFAVPMRQYYSGDVAVVATALLGKPDAEPFSLHVTSEMVGVISELPYPLNKTAARSDALDLQISFPADGLIGLTGSLERGLNWAVQMEAVNDSWKLGRGMVNSGSEPVTLPAESESGVIVRGYLDGVHIDEWVGLSLVSSAGEESSNIKPSEAADRWQEAFNRADLQIGEMFVMGYRFDDIDAQVAFGADDWDIDVSGPWAEGNILLPYDFNEQTFAALNMQRLLLIEPEFEVDGSDAGDDVTDPRNLPAVKAQIENFAIGSLRFGALSADIVRVPDGLKSRSLTTKSTSFTTEISTDWLVIDNAQRTRLNVEILSTDVADTLEKLGYSPVLTGKTGTVNAKLLWEGGPGMELIYASTGELSIDFRDGRVNDLDAGGGRLIGLFSLAALPRRLALDFRDVTADGLEYSALKGLFRMDFGDAWTCNMGLTSEVADIAIVGRTGMLAADYDQLAVVRPHVTSMLPLPAVVLGGPTLGVATLLISQLFKKPLSNIGETYYSVEGTWDVPEYKKLQRAEIDIASFAECEQQLPNLSPDEIAALEELLNEPAGTPDNAVFAPSEAPLN
jgi:uncharacterized protein (TIGR02099 family)